MVELNAKTPLDGNTLIKIKGVELREVELGPITSIVPYRGQEMALSVALQSAHGMALPMPNRMAMQDDAHAIWFGYDLTILTGITAHVSLGQYAALTDQSDAWAAVQVQGQGAADVLARLTPLDLRASVFQTGHTARTELMHMPASITCLGDQRFMVMVFRSMAGTLWHDVQRALEGVAARR